MKDPHATRAEPSRSGTSCDTAATAAASDQNLGVDTPPQVQVSEVELTVLDACDEIAPFRAVEHEWFTVAVLAVPHNSPAVGQGRHLHTSPLAAPTAPAEQQRGVVRIGHRSSSLVDFVLVVLQELSDERRGLLDTQALAYQYVEHLPVDLHIVLLLEVEITHMALNVYKIVIVNVCES
jgi:hypothetical protein